MSSEKTVSVRMSRENLRELDALAGYFGENYNQVLRRALMALFDKYQGVIESDSEMEG